MALIAEAGRLTAGCKARSPRYNPIQSFLLYRRLSFCMRSSMRLIAAATCILVSLSAAVGACSEPENANQRERVAVVAQELRSLPEQSTLEAIGSARAATSAQIFPESDGRVTRVLFSAGEFVRKGQPLIEMDARRERLAVEAARVEVREAEQLLSRYRRIEDTGAISDSQIEAGETALASAGVALRQAQVALDDRVVRAPFSGHVGLTEVDPGDRIDSATPIAQLDSRGTLYVDFPAPEAVFRELRAGQTVRVTPFAGTADPIAARVVATDTRISRDSRDFIVRAAIPNEGDRLRPGMSFRVVFARTGETRPAVPEQAIVWGSDGSYLFVVRDETAQRVPITITSRREGLAFVEGELSPNDRVIIEGVQKVRDGQAIRLVRPAGPPTREVEVRSAGDGPGEGNGG